MYKVYAKVDEKGRIIAINSDAFLSNMEGWTLIDEGEGDRYHHAQGNYFAETLMNDVGTLRYKLEEGKVIARTASEMAEDEVAVQETPSTEERLSALEQAGLERDSALMELASLIATLMGGAM